MLFRFNSEHWPTDFENSDDLQKSLTDIRDIVRAKKTDQYKKVNTLIDDIKKILDKSKPEDFWYKKGLRHFLHNRKVKKMSNNVKSERKNKNLDPNVKSKALKRAEKEEEQRAAAELKKREKKRGKHMNDLKLKQRAAEKLKLEKKAEEEIQDQEAMQQG